MEVGVGPADRVSEHLTVTAGRRDQPEQHADRGGLARSVRSDEPGYPTFGQVEFDLVDGPQVAEVLGQTGGLIEALCLPSHLDPRPVGFDKVWHRR